jgi:hypothetical protein
MIAPTASLEKGKKLSKRMAAHGQIKQSAEGKYCAFSASSPLPEQ